MVGKVVQVVKNPFGEANFWGRPPSGMTELAHGNFDNYAAGWIRLEGSPLYVLAPHVFGYDGDTGEYLSLADLDGGTPD